MAVPGEVIYVDDGSTDGTAAEVEAFIADHPSAPIRLVRHSANRGITAAIVECASLARGKFICYVPADMESRPDKDIPILYEALDSGTDLVVGYRKGRGDRKVRTSRIYNFVNRLLFGVRVHDANWIKLVRREKMAELQLGLDWHRFLVPILVHRGCHMKEVETQWHPREYGRSKFGTQRILVSIIDLVSVRILLSFGRRLLLFFIISGFLAILLSVVCAVVAIAVGVSHPVWWSGGWAAFAAFLVIGCFLWGVGIAVEFIRFSRTDTWA